MSFLKRVHKIIASDNTLVQLAQHIRTWVKSTSEISLAYLKKEKANLAKLGLNKLDGEFTDREGETSYYGSDGLYRGHEMSQKEYEDLQNGKPINIKKGSWTFNMEEAMDFSFGKKTSSRDTVSVVFKCDPTPNDVIINLIAATVHPKLDALLDIDIREIIRSEEEVILDTFTVTKENIELDNHELKDRW